MKFKFMLALLVATASAALLAQSPGMFTATGNMTAPRASHTATLLNNGNVLIAGGASSASADLYDPRTGTFTPTGELTIPRRLHTATLLANGKVLITGGTNGEGNFATAELYDPSTGTFTATGSMVSPRIFHTATLLHDGRVLITGGYDSSSPAKVEVYDPSTGMFRRTGDYGGIGGCDPCAPATLLPNGQVLFVGQRPGQLYDARSETFIPTGTMLDPAHSTAILLANGNVLFAGGIFESRTAKAELFDPLTGTFASTGEMASPRIGHTATLLPNGIALITGGDSEDCCFFIGSLASAETYDASTGVFSAAGNMTARRREHTATLLQDGRVLIAGGDASGGIGVFLGTSDSAELYEPPILEPAPVLLSTSSDAQGQGAILHGATHQAVSSGNPTLGGEEVEIYLTGLLDGSVIPPQVAIGGRMTKVLFFGSAPGFEGLNQVNVRVPGGVAAGPAVPVHLTYIGRASNEVTIAVQ